MTNMRIALTLGLALAACQGDDDVSLGDDGSQLCGAAMDAEGTGQCDEGLGIIWDGTECVGIAGCDCVGADCDRLYSDYEECQSDCQQACDSSNDPTPCPDGLFCMAPNFGCGAGYCQAPLEQCDVGPVCGCDGITYETMCDAQMAGIAPDEFVACAQ